MAQFRKDLFKYQLERDSLANTFMDFTLMASCSEPASNVLAAVT